MLIPKLERTEWLTFALPLMVFICVLISIGPVLQPYVFSIADTKAPSVYEAAHETGIVQFPSFLDWVGFAFHPIYIAQAVFVCLVALRRKCFGEFSLFLGVSSFVVLTVTDLALGLIYGDTNAKNYLVNVLANILGGVFFFFISSAILYIRQILVPMGKGGIYALPAIIIGASLFLSALCYFFLTWIYQPTVVRLDANFAIPSEGYFVPFYKENGSGSEPDEKRIKKFSFLPDESEAETVEISSPKQSPFVIFTGAEGSSYDFEASFFSNCFRGLAEKKKLKASNPLKVEDVKSVSISLDRRFSEFLSLEKTKVSIDQRQPTFYWIRQDKDSENGIRIQNFLGDEDVISLRNSSGFSFFISGPLLDIDDDKTSRTSRTVNVSIDDSKFSIELKPGTLNDTQRALDCSPVHQNSAGILRPGKESERAIQLPDNTLGAGLLVKVTKRNSLDANLRHGDAELKIQKSNGWLSVNSPDFGREGTSYLGTTRLISFEGNIQEMEADGNKIDVLAGETITANGSITGRIAADGAVSVSGRAEALWKGNSRLNPTRWERMATELQVLMLTFLGFGCLAIIRWYRPIWKRIVSNETLLSI